MGLQQLALSRFPSSTAELNYLAPTPGKPRTYAYDPPPGEPHNRRRCPNRTTFRSSMGADRERPSLDREGFALVKHPTVVKDFLQRQGSTRASTTPPSRPS